jgi:hypothetical protein
VYWSICTGPGGKGNEFSESCGDGIGCGVGSVRCLLCRGKDRAVLQDALMLAERLVAEEEKSVVFPDGAADGEPVVVALEGSFGAGRTGQREARGRIEAAIEVVASVEGFVAEVIECFTVKVV